MSSRGKNFRRRSEDGDDANGDEDHHPKSTTATSSSKTKTLAKPKPSKPEAPKRLSFADDDEGDDAEEGPFAQRHRPLSRPSRAVPAVAPSVHRLTAAKDRVKSSGLVAPPPIPSNLQSQAGEYTKERLRELQKNARPLPGSLVRAPPPPPVSEARAQKQPGPAAAAAAEPVIVLKGLVKPMAEASIGPRKPREVEDEDEDEENDNVENTEDDDSRMGKGRGLPVIPDRATIEAIRAKRQQLQQPRHAAPDYISLDSGGLLSSRGSTAAGGSSDEEDDESQGRIAMFGNKSGSRTSKGVFDGIKNSGAAAALRGINGGFREVVDTADEDDDEDEEERKWEEEQFRKGLGRRVEDVSTQRMGNGIMATATVQPQPSGYSVANYHQPSLGTMPSDASVFVSRSAEFLSIAQQAEIATQALQDNINKLKETHKTTLNSLVRTDTNLSEALSEISTLENSMKAAEKKYVYMQELQDYISVMCDFLNDKAFFIEELEEHMQKLHEQRALAVSERRAADLADESSEVEAAVNAAMSVLGRGSSSAYLSAATSAAQAAAAAAREGSNLPPELDEFGRDINLQKRMDIKRREEGRKRRKARLESKRLSSVGKNNACEQIEGEVSTDESDSESSAYQSSRNELLKTVDLVFSDAADEYSNLRIVKEKFEGWKDQYPLAYRDAHVPLSAPAVFSPYVRLELLKWDPLYDSTDFFDMEWHRLLFDYGMQGKESNLDPDDADANLIPELVEKVALPILHHEITHCWDIVSARRTKNAVEATSMVINYVPGSSKALRELLSAVNSRLTEAVASLTVPAWGSMVTRAVPGAAQYAAYRFGVSVRLLRNICLWKDILARPILEKLALEELLRGKILPHVKSIASNIHDAITRAERIVASLTGVWSGPDSRAESCQKLQPLLDFVADLGNKLERRYTSGVSEEETHGLARRIKNMLVALNEYDKARTVLRTFQLREAL